MKLPAAMQRAIDISTAKAVAAQLAQRTQAAPADVSGKGIIQKPDMRLAVGLRLKGMWGNNPMFAAKSSDSDRAWVQKNASAYEGMYGQGGSLLKQEYSSEIIEMLRPQTALLRAGARQETYTGSLSIGRLNGGASAQFVAEAQSPAKSQAKTGAVVLGSHKLMAIYEPSNDLLRNPSINSAQVLTDDLLAAMALAADKAGFMGDGTGPNPLGLIKQVKSTNKVAGVAITNANRAAVIRFVDGLEQKVKSSGLELEINKPFYSFSSAVETALKGLYFENGGWVFRNQLEQGKLNGKPTFVTEAYGDNHFFFGLANQIYFGLDNKGSGDVIVEMAQPNFEQDLTMIRAIMYMDWKLRHDTACAYSDNVTLS